MENKPIIAVLDNDRIQHFILEKTFRACHVEARIKNFYLVEQLTAHLIANFNNTAELPDLILMEIYLPMEDGWFFLENLSRMKNMLIKFPPVLVVSNSIDSKEIELALANPLVMKFIEKPLDEPKVNLINNFLVKVL